MVPSVFTASHFPVTIQKANAQFRIMLDRLSKLNSNELRDAVKHS